MKKIIIVISLFLVFSNAYSNNSDPLLLTKDTTIECTVVTKSNGTYKEVNISGLKDSTIMIMKDKFSKEILIKDLQSIKFKTTGFWKGAAGGAGLAIVLGMLVGSLDSTIESLWIGVSAGLALAVPFALLGGLTAAFLVKDHVYNLRKMDFEAKRTMLKYIIKEYTNR